METKTCTKCKDCKWWIKYTELFGEISDVGFCHRFPKREEKNEKGFCGEFKQRTKEKFDTVPELEEGLGQARAEGGFCGTGPGIARMFEKIKREVEWQRKMAKEKDKEELTVAKLREGAALLRKNGAKPIVIDGKEYYRMEDNQGRILIEA